MATHPKSRSLESPYVKSSPPGRLTKHSQLYHWTGWKNRHWPADIVRPGQAVYGFDNGDRLLKVLFRITHGGSFTYQSKHEFARQSSGSPVGRQIVLILTGNESLEPVEAISTLGSLSGLSS